MLYLDAKRVCERYNLSRSHLFDLVARGQFPRPEKFGHCSRWSIRALEAADVSRAAQAAA
jgi:predicted DNA-binding transcriptional regulator AlpA